MNDCYIAAKRMGVDVLAYYIINIPKYRERGNYTQGLSINYFTSRELKRFSKMYHGKIPWDIFYEIKSKNSFDYERCEKLNGGEYMKKHQEELDKLPQIICNGVWDFYEKIGYDRKTKKYLDEIKPQILCQT